MRNLADFMRVPVCELLEGEIENSIYYFRDESLGELNTVNYWVWLNKSERCLCWKIRKK